MPLNPFHKWFKAATTKKTPFFARRQKMPIFTLDQFFLGPSGQLVPPLPFF